MLDAESPTSSHVPATQVVSIGFLAFTFTIRIELKSDSRVQVPRFIAALPLARPLSIQDEKSKLNPTGIPIQLLFVSLSQLLFFKKKIRKTNFSIQTQMSQQTNKKVLAKKSKLRKRKRRRRRKKELAEYVAHTRTDAANVYTGFGKCIARGGVSVARAPAA